MTAAPYAAGDVIDTEYGPVTVASIEQVGTRGVDGLPLYDVVLVAADGVESHGHGVFRRVERPDQLSIAWDLARSAWLRARGGYQVGDTVQGRPVVERTPAGSLICGADGEYVVFNPSGWRTATRKTLAAAQRQAARADAAHEEVPA